MAKIHQVLVATLILQVCTNAAPSDISKLEGIANVEQDVKLDEEPQTLVEETKDENNSTIQGQRQKRFYNYYGYPPVNPINYPSYFSNRDVPADNGGFPYEDPLTHIYRRLQDIATVIRQPNLPPPPPPGHFPIYVPVIYIPQFGCQCGTGQNVPRPTQNGTSTDNIGISNRFPEMEDENQNWGLVVNETVVDDGKEEDFRRPISFVPILPDRPMSRPPPAVEHGSSQGGLNSAQTTTTNRPFENPNDVAPPNARIEPPSACDGAVLSCCHQPEVTYNCFAVQGCPDPTSFGNPCEPQVILRVIDKFQQFYNRRAG